MKVPFAPPYIDDAVLEEVADTLMSGWITTGPKVKALEELVSEMVGVDAVVGVNSATSGLMLMLKWFGVGPGDEVIVPAYTYCATALAVIHCGARPVMVDVGSDYNIDVEKIAEAINERTKAIIPVDFAGWPCDYNEIERLVVGKKQVFVPSNSTQEKLGRILILADAAHSLGARYGHKMIGSCADATVFSFHAVKNVTTAEGGMVCLNLPSVFDPQESYQHLRTYTLNGQSKDALTKTQVGGWKYDILFAGMKINMPDVCAAIGLAQIREYEKDLLPKRKAIFNRYVSAFEPRSWALIPELKNENKEGSAHLFPLRVKGVTEPQRDKIIEAISSKEVAVNVHFRPLPDLSLFKEMGYRMTDYPVSYSMYENEISLPIYAQMTDEQVSYVIETVVNSVEKYI